MDKIYRLNLKPLSINKAWQGRRFKTKEYKDWTEEGLKLLNKKKIKAINGKCKIEICFVMKNAIMSDIDNPVKALLDLLVKAHLIKDDRYLDELEVKKEKGKKDYILFKISKM